MIRGNPINSCNDLGGISPPFTVQYPHGMKKNFLCHAIHGTARDACHMGAMAITIKCSVAVVDRGETLTDAADEIIM